MQHNEKLSFEVEANMEDVNREIENTKDKCGELFDEVEQLHSLMDDMRPILSIRNSNNCHFSITINKGDK